MHGYGFQGPPALAPGLSPNQGPTDDAFPSSLAVPSGTEFPPTGKKRGAIFPKRSVKLQNLPH